MMNFIPSDYFTLPGLGAGGCLVQEQILILYLPAAAVFCDVGIIVIQLRNQLRS